MDRYVKFAMNSVEQNNQTVHHSTA